MKWSAIILFSCTGACMGALSLFGYTANTELILWTVIALIAAIFVARITTNKIFLHGVFIGIGSGIANAGVQILFFGLFVRNNQFAAAELRHFSSVLSPQMFILLSSPVIGGVYGLIIGALSVAASKFHHPK